MPAEHGGPDVIVPEAQVTLQFSKSLLRATSHYVPQKNHVHLVADNLLTSTSQGYLPPFDLQENHQLQASNPVDKQNGFSQRTRNDESLEDPNF